MIMATGLFILAKIVFCGAICGRQSSPDYMERKAVEKQQAVALLFMYMYITLNIWGVFLCLCLFQKISGVSEKPLSPF